MEEAKAQVEREEEKTAKTTDSVFVNQNTRAEAREAGRSWPLVRLTDRCTASEASNHFIL